MTRSRNPLPVTIRSANRPADEADALKKALAASPDGLTAAEASARLGELGL
jgi:hypothetical protein